MAGFLKVILDWCQEEDLQIADKIKIVNFNYRVRSAPIFDMGNPLSAYWDSMLYLMFPEHIWRDFSYNHIQTLDEHFFFPPWSWEKRQLWL